MDYLTLILAIAMVESGQNPHAFNESEGARGLYQIRPIYVADCNRIQQTRVYTLEDCYDQEKSIEMMMIYWGHYASKDRLGQDPTYEILARMHNGSGATGHKKKSTLDYWQRVRQQLNRLEQQRRK